MPLLAWVLALAACGHVSTVPDWMQKAQAHADLAARAWLSEDEKSAQEHWRLAELETRRTADPRWLAQLALQRCAVQVAARQLGQCEAFGAYAQDASAQSHAYFRYLSGQALASDWELLSEQQQALVQADAARVLYLISRLDSPLERLVGAGVAYGRGLASPALLQMAVDTASLQGWTKALSAWLRAQRSLAQRLGDQAELQRIDRRLALIEPAAQ